MVILLADDVDAQLHGCLLSMGADQQSVTPHLTNFTAASGASFTRRENNVSNDALRRQSMVYTYTSLFTEIGSAAAGASLNEPPPPNYYNWPSVFWRPFFSRHLLEQQPSYICMGALRSPFYSLLLPLRQPVRPFTTNKALPGFLYTAIGPFFPLPPPVKGFWVGLRRLWKSVAHNMNIELI